MKATVTSLLAGLMLTASGRAVAEDPASARQRGDRQPATAPEVWLCTAAAFDLAITSTPQISGAPLDAEKERSSGP